MSYADQLPSFLSNQMAVVSLGKFYQPLFPRWYNPNATCTYQGVVPGHSVEQCVAFKHKVQSLIDVGWLTFQEDSPNVRINPFANHGSLAVNAMEKWKSQELKQIGDVSTPKQFILEALREAGVIKCGGNKEDSCLIHPGVLHDVERCPIAKELLQGLISRGQIEIHNAKKEEGEVFMQSSDRSPSKPMTLVIHFTRDITTQIPRGF